MLFSVLVINDQKSKHAIAQAVSRAIETCANTIRAIKMTPINASRSLKVAKSFVTVQTCVFASLNEL